RRARRPKWSAVPGRLTRPAQRSREPHLRTIDAWLPPLLDSLGRRFLTERVPSIDDVGELAPPRTHCRCELCLRRDVGFLQPVEQLRQAAGDAVECRRPLRARASATETSDRLPFEGRESFGECTGGACLQGVNILERFLEVEQTIVQLLR